MYHVRSTEYRELTWHILSSKRIKLRAGLGVLLPILIETFKIKCFFVVVRGGSVNNEKKKDAPCWCRCGGCPINERFATSPREGFHRRGDVFSRERP